MGYSNAIIVNDSEHKKFESESDIGLQHLRKDITYIKIMHFRCFREI